MARRIRRLEDPPRLEVTFAGPVTFADRVDALSIYVPQAQAHSITRFLVDFSAAWHEPESPESTLELERAIEAQDLGPNKCIALVNCPRSHLLPTERAAERAGITVRAFYSHEGALRWIESCKGC